jgi:EmrB/QacA subfamily drug resistance transporter
MSTEHGMAQMTGGGSSSRLILVAVAGASIMSGLDATIVETAIPNIAHSLDERPLRLGLTISIYLLSLAIFTPLSTWIVDRFGIRRSYLSAIGIFVAGSLLCGISTSLGLMLGGRLIQGAGAALMGSVGQISLLRYFPKGQLIKATSIVVVAGQTGPLVAPLLGGYLTTELSWRWIFLINIPIGLIEAALVWRVFDNTAMTDRNRFDFKGFLVLSVALCCIQLTTDVGARSFLTTPSTLGLLALGITAALLYWRHALVTPTPLLDIKLLRIRTYAISIFAGAATIIGITAMNFLLPLLLQIGFGMSAIQSGSRSFVTTVGVLGIRSLLPPILRALGFRRLLVANTLIMGLMIMGFAMLRTDMPAWLMIFYIFVFGCSRSFHWSNGNALGYAELEPQQMSKAAALTALGNQMAQTIGIGFSASLLAFMAHGSDGGISVNDFRVAFCIIGLIAWCALFGYLRLKPEDGQAVSNHRSRSSGDAAPHPAE